MVTTTIMTTSYSRVVIVTRASAELGIETHVADVQAGVLAQVVYVLYPSEQFP